MARVADRLALVGCGHIGGSLALGLRASGGVGVIAGCDADPTAAARARERGICDEALSLEEAVAGADLVVLATPVRTIAALLGRVAAAATPGAVVTDVGSTKREIVRAGEAALGGRFVGGHPMAGTERAGPDAADARLYAGRKVILTPTATTDARARDHVTALWQACGATVIEMDAGRHDEIMAAVSHLPHAAAYALAGAIGALGGRELVGMTGGGFLDTTRIASTPPAMWVDVFLDNRAAVLGAMDAFEGCWRELRAAIEAGDGAAIARILDGARRARERILGGGA